MESEQHGDGLEHGERGIVYIKHDKDQDWEDTTEEDYDEVKVFDHVTVVQSHYVNSVNGHETHTQKIAGGDSFDLPEPDAITQRVAEWIQGEFSVSASELERRDIQVVDMSRDDVCEA